MCLGQAAWPGQGGCSRGCCREPASSRRHTGSGSGIHGRCPPATPTPRCHLIAETRARAADRRTARGSGCSQRAQGERRRPWGPGQRGAPAVCGLTLHFVLCTHSGQGDPRAPRGPSAQTPGCPHCASETSGAGLFVCLPQLSISCGAVALKAGIVRGRHRSWRASPFFVFSSHVRGSALCPRRHRLYPAQREGAGRSAEMTHSLLPLLPGCLGTLQAETALHLRTVVTAPWWPGMASRSGG